MTQYLIDTHVAYWLISGDREHLPDDIRDDIETFQNQYFIELFVATERNAKLRYEGYKKLSEM